MWRAPALDFIVNAGMTYHASTGMRVDRHASVIAAGEIARLSYDSILSTDRQGKPDSLRLRAYRSDPDGGLLGPLNATHFAVGDVSSLSSRLLTTSNGRGAQVTNRPLFNPMAFDRTRFEGDLPAGWDAELYRNGELLAFSRSDGSQRYVFDNVPMIYGDNRFEIILNGPQGQQRSRIETINIAQNQVPAGKTWYWAGINQPRRDMLSDIVGRDDGGGPPVDREPGDFRDPDLQAAVQVEHGLGKRTSIGLLATALLAGNEKLTFVEGSVRRSIGPALVEAAVARDGKGGMAIRAQAVARLGSVNVSAEALLADYFVINGQREKLYRDARLSVDAPLKLGRQSFSAHGDVRLIDRGNDNRVLNSAGRLSANFNGFNLTSLVNWEKRLGRNTSPDRLEVGLLGTGRVGEVRLRGEALWELKPENRLRTAGVSAYWSASERVDWEGALGYDAVAKRGLARVAHVRRFNSLAAAASIEAGTDGSFAAGINLNFSLDSSAGGFKLSSQRLASTGSVEARVYRDLNDNGVHDASEPWEQGATITTGQRVSEEVTDKRGVVRVGGLQPFRPLAVGIDTSSLADPALAPRKALQVVVPRPGVAAKLDIGLVGSGDIEGALVQEDGRGLEGLDVELLDVTGKVASTARSDYDGFFLLERIAYGRYTMRLSATRPRLPTLTRPSIGRSRSARKRPSSASARSASRRSAYCPCPIGGRLGPNVALTKSRLARLSPRQMPVPEGKPFTSLEKWCGRENSNFHGLSPTTTSTLRVYQFRHDRTREKAAHQLWGAALGRARPLAKRTPAGNGHRPLRRSVHFGTIVNRLVTIGLALHYGARDDRSADPAGGECFARFPACSAGFRRRAGIPADEQRHGPCDR